MGLIGCVDTLAEGCIAGWAAEDATRDQPVEVDVIVNSRIVATLACDTFREDLLRAGIGDGRKAFLFDPSKHLKPGRNVLEVRFAGTDRTLHQGCGHWVGSRTATVPEEDAALLAALDAYYEFKPENDVLAIGESAKQLEGLFIQAAVPFRKFVSLEMPPEHKADIAVCWAWRQSPAETIGLALDNTHTPGLLAMGFVETPDSITEMRQAFAACGIWDVRFESIVSARVDRLALAFVRLGNADTAPAQNLPVLAHIHVPKCAGTSFRNLLERHFGPKHLRLYVNDTYFVYGAETLRSYLLRDPEIRGFSSHHVRTFPHWLAGRELLYVTFLRDPIEQFVSYMTHIRKHYSKLTSESLLAAVPPEAAQVTLREFARWLLTQDRDIPFRENHNVNFFARHSSITNPDRLEAAKAALEKFFFVGITERMVESMLKLEAMARTAGLEFPPGPLAVENTSADCRDDLSWITPDDEVGSLLLHSVEKDKQLYDWAAARLDRIGC